MIRLLIASLMTPDGVWARDGHVHSQWISERPENRDYYRSLPRLNRAHYYDSSARARYEARTDDATLPDYWWRLVTDLRGGIIASVRFCQADRQCGSSWRNPPRQILMNEVIRIIADGALDLVELHHLPAARDPRQ